MKSHQMNFIFGGFYMFGTTVCQLAVPVVVVPAAVKVLLLCTYVF